MRITKLDGLRGIFSIMIIFFHYYELEISNHFYDFFFIKESYLFVDFFFVLSGFVIAYNYNNFNKFNDFILYIKKRFIRLYPLLVFTSIVFLIAEFCGFYAENQNFNKGFLTFQLKGFFNVLLLSNSTPFLGIANIFNPPTWSISSEFISYFTYGLATLFLFKRLKSAFFIFLILISIVFIAYTGNFDRTFDHGYIRGFLSFFIGYFTWTLYKKEFKLSNVWEYILPVIMIVLFYISDYIHSNYGDHFRQKFVLIIPFFFGLFILILTKTNGRITQLLNTEPIAFLGRISYSIYLNHYVFLLFIPSLILKSTNNQNWGQIVTLLSITILVIVFSNFTYKYIELKFSKLFKRKFIKNTSNLN